MKKSVLSTTMRFVRVLPLLLVAVPSLLSQSPSGLFDKAPPHIDAALRERVDLFYQAHVDGKFRLADTVVHEDSKDAFFVADKSQYGSYEIIRINYAEEFTRAQVVTMVDTDFFVPGVGSTPVKVPLTTFWKTEAGEWWWYVIPRSKEGTVTPFGIMKAGDENDETSPYYKLKNMKGADELASKVDISKRTVSLVCGADSQDEIVVSNGMPGAVALDFATVEDPGFELKIEKEQVESGEEGRLVFSCPDSERAGTEVSGMLSIRPTGHQIPISIRLLGPGDSEAPAEQ